MSTYSQIYIQIVFAVKNRQALIANSWQEELYKYVTGIVQNKGQKMLAINGMPDHIHILIGMKPSCCLSDLVREIKKSSNSFVKEKEFSKYKFEWQEGFGAFSYSHSSLDNVIGYIKNQKEHHKKRSFKEEYIDFLEKFQIEFKDEYLFEWIEQNPKDSIVYKKIQIIVNATPSGSNPTNEIISINIKPFRGITINISNESEGFKCLQKNIDHREFDPNGVEPCG